MTYTAATADSASANFGQQEPEVRPRHADHQTGDPATASEIDDETVGPLERSDEHPGVLQVGEHRTRPEEPELASRLQLLDEPGVTAGVVAPAAGWFRRRG